MKRYVIIVDGEVGPDLVFDPEASNEVRALAAILSSNPTTVEIDYTSEVTMGWTWDGTTFFPPAE
jgi:hypothetical protein